jgi:hypothetical protein
MLIDLSRVRVSGPLSAFATGFADHMTRQGYSPSQTRMQLWLLNRLSNWLASEGLVVGELRAKEVEQFQLSRYEAGYRFLRSIRAMQPILGYPHGRFGIQSPFLPMPLAYRHRLRGKRIVIARQPPCPTDLKKPPLPNGNGGDGLPSQWFDLCLNQFGSCRNAITSPLDWITNVDNG